MKVRGACHHDCPDTCGWVVTVENGEAVELRGDPDHPYSAGELCPKVNRFLDRAHHADRVLTPLRRVGPKGSGEFEPISWDRALDEIKDRLSTVRDTSGPQAICQFSFDGTQGLVHKGVVADRFFAHIGALDIRRHLCGVTAWLGASDVTGTPYGIDPEDLAHSRTIVLWGTNTFLTNRHLWPTVEKARAAGAEIIVVDPLTTATARKADRHLALRPGSDVALVLGLLAVVDREGWWDEAWLEETCIGADELLGSVHAFGLDAAIERTGLAESDITHLAARLVNRQPAAIRTLVGPEHRRDGRQIMRAISTLAAALGLGRLRGGGQARSTQVYFEEALNLPDHAALGKRPSINMAELGSALTGALPNVEVEALVVHNSNPATICPDQNRVIAGLERDDLFTVVVEQFLTDTARYADLILPAATQIEQLDLSIAWGHLYLALNQPAISPRGEARTNADIFRALARRFGFDDELFDLNDEGVIRQLLKSDHEWLAGIDYERLLDGPARLQVEAPPPATTYQLGPLVDATPAPPPDYPLMLASPKHHPAFLNANYAFDPAHHPPSGGPAVLLHPHDAAVRDIVGGAEIDVHNERGRLRLVARLTDVVPPGVVAIPFGWWTRHHPDGRSVNALTDPTVPDDGQGSAAFADTWVEVSPTGV